MNGGLASELCYLTASPGRAGKHLVPECTSNQIGVRVVVPFVLQLKIFFFLNYITIFQASC